VVVQIFVMKLTKKQRVMSSERLGWPFEENGMDPWHQEFHLMHFLLVFPKTPIPTPTK